MQIGFDGVAIARRRSHFFSYFFLMGKGRPTKRRRINPVEFSQRSNETSMWIKKTNKIGPSFFFYIKRGVSFDFFLGFPFGRHVFFGPIKRKEKKRDATFSLFFSFSHLFSCFAFYFVGSDFFSSPFTATLCVLSLSLSLSLFFDALHHEIMVSSAVSFTLFLYFFIGRRFVSVWVFFFFLRPSDFFLQRWVYRVFFWLGFLFFPKDGRVLDLIAVKNFILSFIERWVAWIDRVGTWFDRVEVDDTCQTTTKKNSVKLGNRSDRYGANVAISSLDPPRFFYFFKKKKLIANGVSRRSFVFFVMEGFVSNLT